MEQTTFCPPHPVHLGLTLGPLRRGSGDPCMRIGHDGVWRATRTPDGPATVHLRISNSDPGAGDQAVTARAWGPGAGWALRAVPALVGAADDDGDFLPAHPVLRDLHRRLAGLRLGRSGAVVEAMVPTVLEQKVVGLDAKRSYAHLVRELGERAPGPASLFVPPDPDVLASIPYHRFHRFGIERRRADTVRAVCTHAAALERAAGLPPAEAQRTWMVLPGVGPWTAAEVALRALGDADSVSVGDYHLPHQVAWALAGEARADDARMLELLEPYRGQRGRAIRLVVAGAPRPPRFGPRSPRQDISRL